MIDLKDYKDKPELVTKVDDPIDAIFKVEAYGELKYGQANSWMYSNDSTHSVHIYLNALARHLKAHTEGEINDPESGFPHSWHALSNINAIAYHINQLVEGSRITGLIVK